MRLLEGFVQRVARARDPDAYALRGGMLVKRWIPAFARTVRDVDLVCRFPAPELRSRVAEIVAIHVDDGIAFDRTVRIDRIPNAAQLFLRGTVAGQRSELAVDVSFLEVTPRRHDNVFTCPPEMVIATKLTVISELGPRSWRTKDLADLWHLLRRFSPGDARANADVLTRSWWRDPHTAARWARYTVNDSSVPTDLDGVVAEVHSHLRRS
jgi:hypothetical protein